MENKFWKAFYEQKRFSLKKHGEGQINKINLPHGLPSNSIFNFHLTEAANKIDFLL